MSKWYVYLGVYCDLLIELNDAISTDEMQIQVTLNAAEFNYPLASSCLVLSYSF